MQTKASIITQSAHTDTVVMALINLDFSQSHSILKDIESSFSMDALIYRKEYIYSN